MNSQVPDCCVAKVKSVLLRIWCCNASMLLGRVALATCWVLSFVTYSFCRSLRRLQIIIGKWWFFKNFLCNPYIYPSYVISIVRNSRTRVNGSDGGIEPTDRIASHPGLVLGFQRDDPPCCTIDNICCSRLLKRTFSCQRSLFLFLVSYTFFS